MTENARVSRLEIVFAKGEPSSFAVTLAYPYEIGGEQYEKEVGPMPPEAAEAKGFDLAAILKDLNVSALKENAAQRASKRALEEEYAAFRTSAERLAAEAKAAGEVAAQAISERDAEIVALRAKLSELEKPAEGGEKPE